jgi:hypothetical protein
MAAKQVLVAAETFSVDLDGEQVLVWKGETKVPAGHPLAKGREHLFEPVESHGVRAAPKRRRRKP